MNIKKHIKISLKICEKDASDILETKVYYDEHYDLISSFKIISKDWLIDVYQGDYGFNDFTLTLWRYPWAKDEKLMIDMPSKNDQLKFGIYRINKKNEIRFTQIFPKNQGQQI